MNTQLLENRKNMKNAITQFQLIMIIKNLQEENITLRQKNEELQSALEEKIENIDAKKLLLVRPKEW